MSSGNICNERFQSQRFEEVRAAMEQRRRAVAPSDSTSTLSLPLPVPPEPDWPGRSEAEGRDGPATGERRAEAARERLRRAARLLEAQELFSQSLDLKDRALARLAGATATIARRATPSRIIRRVAARQSSRLALASVAEEAGAATETPVTLRRALDDFRERKKNLHAAAEGLDRVRPPFSSGRPSADRLEVLEYRHEAARCAYNVGLGLLESELSRLAAERRATVERCFATLAPLVASAVDSDERLLEVMREAFEGIRRPNNKPRGRSRDRNKQSE